VGSANGYFWLSSVGPSPRLKWGVVTIFAGQYSEGFARGLAATFKSTNDEYFFISLIINFLDFLNLTQFIFGGHSNAIG
jgi:hypothetical protein